MKQTGTLLRWRAAALLAALCMAWALALQLAMPVFAQTGGDALLQNGDFENTADAAWEGEPVGWSVSLSDGAVWGEYAVKTDAWAADPDNHFLHLANYDQGVDLQAAVTQTLTLAAGTYAASVRSAGENQGAQASTLALTVSADGEVLASAPLTLSGWDVWSTASLAFTLEAETEVTVGVTGTLADSAYCDLDNAALEETAAAEGYAVSVSVDAPEAQPGDTVTLTAQVTADGVPVTDLAAAGLQFTFWADSWNDHSDGNGDAVITDEHSLTASATLPSEGTYYIVGELYDADWNVLASAVAVITVAQAQAVTAPINVERVPGLAEDFMMGVDISSLPAQLASGVTYRDFDGNTIDTVAGFCRFMAECGVTHVRVRVWNDPYDAAGNGYGGGNNDVAAAVELAEGCAAAGLGMLVDFHCSDFWTDPGKQMTPKAWAGYTVAEKAEALGAFVTDALTRIRATGADVAMVQIGNETNGGFIGETAAADMCTLFSAGAAAVRALDQDIRVVIHVTNPEKTTLTSWAARLAGNGVDYDVLATSYYPSWHGTLDNLKSQLRAVQETYGKEVLVAETSYAYTLEDTDGHDNTIRQGNNTDMMCETRYPFTVQGQAGYLRDLIAAASEAGSLGVFYWEPAWITVGDTTGLTGEAYTARVEANRAIWEQYGSGWASSYAAEYDPDDAGKWYGGSAVDNQALFAADGTALASAKVWRYVRTGAVSDSISVDAVGTAEQTICAGEAYTLPATIPVTYNTGTVEEPVSWDAAGAAVDTSTPGIYVVQGTVTFSKTVDAGAYAGKTTAAVTCTITVKAPNLITDPDDAGFEKGDHFTITGTGINLPARDDPKEGSYSMHWWSEQGGTGAVTYDVPISLAAGSYTFEAAAQGCAGDAVTLKILDAAGGELFCGTPAILTGWANWMTPSVSFTLTEPQQVLLQIQVDMQAGGWGTADCLYLYRTGDAPETPPQGGDAGGADAEGGSTGGDVNVPGGTSPRTGEPESPAQARAAALSLLALAGAAAAALLPRRRKEE